MNHRGKVTQFQGTRFSGTTKNPRLNELIYDTMVGLENYWFGLDKLYTYYYPNEFYLALSLSYSSLEFQFLKYFNVFCFSKQKKLNYSNKLIQHPLLQSKFWLENQMSLLFFAYCDFITWFPLTILE